MLSTESIKRFGLDFLRIKFPFNEYLEILHQSLRILDDDNSNFSKVWFLDDVYSVARSGRFYLFTPHADGDTGDYPFPVFRVSFDKFDHVVFDVYSSFFHWDRSDGVLALLSTFQYRLLRVDIAMDIQGRNVREVNGLFETKLALTKINERGIDPETLYIGDFKSKRKLIRLYDKKLDSEKKGKTELYPDYFSSDLPVTRLEVELRNQACSSWLLDLRQLENPGHLYHVFYEELNTKFVSCDLPPTLGAWYSKPSFERGIPDPVLRFQEAIQTAIKKGVDIDSVFREYVGSPI